MDSWAFYDLECLFQPQWLYDSDPSFDEGNRTVLIVVEFFFFFFFCGQTLQQMINNVNIVYLNLLK